MVNTRTILLFLGVFSLAFLLEIGTTESRSLSQESSRLEAQSSGDNSIPEELSNNDDDLESDRGSGDAYDKEKSRPFAPSSVFTDKQVDKLIQEEDFGKGEAEGSANNAIPEFKETNDGSGEVIEMENLKNVENQDKKQNAIEDFEKRPSTIKSSLSNQEGEPTIVTGGQATPGVQPAAQVFNDATPASTTQTQTYNYGTAPSADQTQQSTLPSVSQTNTQTYAPPQGSSYDSAASQTATPSSQYYSDASSQATQTTQPSAQTYNDASQQATPNAAQYYNDAASQAAPTASQSAPAAQQTVQAYASEPQNDATGAPQPVDAAIEATHPGAQTANYVPSLASHPSEVVTNADGIPQSVDAATLATPPQQQYYSNPTDQTAAQPAAANDLASSFMANGNGASQQLDASQPVQYTTNEPQNTQAYANQGQTYQGSVSGVEMRKQDALEENRFRTVVCQNNQDTIVCPEGKKINITDARYGSMGYSSCQGPENTNFLPMQACESPNAYNIVKTSCDDMENCMLSANDGIFGDQCQSDKKYLDVNYNCVDKEPPQTQQYMYPGGYQSNPYAYPQQQEQQPQNDEPMKINPPPPPKIPELMSTLVQLSKNKQKYGYLDDQPSCSACNKCSQCYKNPRCGQCSLCKSKLCDQAQASLPMIPKDVRPLWEQWSERTADMNSMEMSGLIFESPKKWLKKLGIHTGGNSKRSHIHSHKKADKKTHKGATKKQS